MELCHKYNNNNGKKAFAHKNHRFNSVAMLKMCGAYIYDSIEPMLEHSSMNVNEQFLFSLTKKCAGYMSFDE